MTRLDCDYTWISPITEGRRFSFPMVFLGFLKVFLKVFLWFSFGFPKVSNRRTKKTGRKPKKTKRKPKENQKKPTSERRQMALSRGGAEGRTAGPLGFGPHLRPLCGPPLQQQHDFWSSPVSVGSTRRVKKKKSEKKGESIIGIFSRIFASLPASSSES